MHPQALAALNPSMPFTPFHFEPGLAFKALGAFLGSCSPVALDSVLHADMKFRAPWSQGNGLLGILPLETLHAVRGTLAVFGVALWLARKWRLGHSGGANHE